MKKINFSGEVFAGRGEGKKYIELQWVKKQIQAKLGFTPYPGTLNLKLLKESANRRKLLGKAAVLKICASGYCTGSIFKASIGVLECGVVIPEVEGYPEDALEVIASVNLKETLRLREGDKVTVTVSL